MKHKRFAAIKCFFGFHRWGNWRYGDFDLTGYYVRDCQRCQAYQLTEITWSAT